MTFAIILLTLVIIRIIIEIYRIRKLTENLRDHINNKKEKNNG